MRISEPLFFQRSLKERIWGSTRLYSRFGWGTGEEKIGESWEISDVPGEESIVRRGQYEGKSLRELMKIAGSEILGTSKPAAGGRFPLLLKFLDTGDLLSVQVHPDDEKAAVLGERDGGKTEAWYFLSVDPGSSIHVGLKPGTTAETLGSAMKNGTVEGLLESLEVQEGEAVLVPAGLVHAIGPGFLLAEVQQTSDVTYRIFDWNRLGIDGKPRALHAEKALQAVDYSFPVPPRKKPKWRKPTRGFREGVLVQSPFFRISQAEVTDSIALKTPGRAVMLMFLKGGGEIHWGGEHSESFLDGDSILIPATLPDYELASADEKLSYLMIDAGPFES